MHWQVWDYSDIEEMMDARERVRREYELDKLPEKLDWRDIETLRAEHSILQSPNHRRDVVYPVPIKHSYFTATGKRKMITETGYQQNEAYVQSQVAKRLESRLTKTKLSPDGVAVLLNYISRVFLAYELRHENEYLMREITIIKK